MEPLKAALVNARNPLGAGALAAILLACGSSAPTHELKDARAAYDDAEEGPAKAHRPGELRAAKQALDRAERAHDEDPGSDREKRLAEEAERRAVIADARGEAAEAEMTARSARQRAARETRGMGPRDERASMAKSNSDKDTNMAKVPTAERSPVRSEPYAERARPGAPRTVGGSDDADAALQQLTPFATVREDDRGKVIVLSGSLLFPSGSTELSPVAEQHLDKVAAALREQPSDSELLIEGYTDSTGSEQKNEQISTKRAQAVADYLAGHDIAQSRMHVTGYGEEQPIADNDDEEGRASNRRVEIVVAKQAQRDREE